MSEPIVEDQPSNGKPEVSNNVDDCSNAVAEFSKSGVILSKEHREKLEACAIHPIFHSKLAMETRGCGSLQIQYLTASGEKELTHEGKPFVRLRLSEEERDRRWALARKKKPTAKRPGRYSSPKNNGCRIYHSPLAVAKQDYEERLNNVSIELRITEGEFKTIAANIHDPKALTIGIGGVSSWRDRYDGQGSDEESKPLVEFDEIPLAGRVIRLCFDSDFHKPQVRKALRDLAHFLDDRGANVIIEVLPSSPVRKDNGDWERLGLDDLIYKYGANSFLEIKKIARPAFIEKKDQKVYSPEFEPRNTNRRNTYLKIILGNHWRASTERNGAWTHWTGTYWKPVYNNDVIFRAIELLMESNGWEDREQRTVSSLVAAFRRSIELNPPTKVKGLIPCQNGCLRLSDKKLLPHDPEHGNTYCLPFKYNPLADAKPIVDVLADMVTPTELNIFRAGAQSVVTGYRRKAFIEITGPGNSGKSVFGRLFTALAGTDNTAASDLEKMEDRSGRFETIKLRGKRLAIFNECDRYSGPLNVIKAMTGGDRITAEIKRGTEPVDFYYTGLTVLIGNSPVRPSDSTGAVINRRRSISVPNVIETNNERELLEPDNGGWRGEFAQHLPGLLNWAIGMSDRDANIALGKDSDDIGRIQRDLDTLFETDNLARWADEHLVYDPDHAFTQVGNPKKTYLNTNVPRSEWENLLLPHYEDRVEFSVGIVKFKNKLVDLLRDTYGLPLPKGSTRHGEYSKRGVGSVIPHVRLRQPVTDKDKVGIVTQAALWKVNPLRNEQPVTEQENRHGQTPVGNECNGCNGFSEVNIDREKTEPSPVLYTSECQKTPQTRFSSSRKGSTHFQPVTPAPTHDEPVTAPMTQIVPERWASGVTTNYEWVCLVIGALEDGSAAVTEDNIYENLKAWETAPDIGRKDVTVAYNRYLQSEQGSLL